MRWVLLLLIGPCYAFASSSLPVADLGNWGKCGELTSKRIAPEEIGLPTRGALIRQAHLVPAGAANPSGEYCLIEGEIGAIGPEGQPIGFSAALPSRWNGKLAQFSLGGFGGSVVPPSAVDGSYLAAPPGLIARGFVVVSSDYGHRARDALDASFALNDETLRNFAGEQLKKTHDVVLWLVRAYYDQEPVHSYFLGGSEGGREGFAVIQQYPKDFDGVVTLFPGHTFTADFLKFQLIRRAMQLNGGIGRISKAKADFLRRRELTACDSLDGLEDSVISNVEACRIDFHQLRCPDGKDSGADCFSDAQLATLQAIQSPNPIPYRLAAGEARLPAYLVGADWGAPGAVSDPSDPTPGNAQAADAFVRYFVLRDEKADTLNFDPMKPVKYLKRVQELSALLDRNSIDINAFLAHGGKWIILHGLADQGAPPTATVDYYERLLAKYGRARTDQFVRLYLVPGYGHARGFSFNANTGPSLDALEDWVERGIAPGTLTIVDQNPEAHGRSRPLCAYPGWPKYAGAADPTLATSFSCVVK